MSIHTMTKSTKTIIIAAALTMLATFPADSASIEEFKTKEYYGSGGLDLINAAEAYAKGYTGKGITIGINDHPVNLEHESFADKTGSKYVGSLNLDGIDWNTYFHGNPMAGIAAGSKNDKVMHGVAFDADIISTSWIGNNFDFPKYDSYPEIKIINNSWGNSESADTFYTSDEVSNLNSKDVLDYLNEKVVAYKNTTIPIKDAASKDRLLVFSNHNYGYADTQAYMFLYWFNNEAVNNIITVTGALNSCDQSEHLKRNPDGTIIGKFLNFASSNFAKYSEDFTLAAPGWNINLSSAVDKNSYFMGSGTSESAAFVFGGAALVQQAFPYMNAKQIGDVLLSTANNKISGYPFWVTVTNKNRYDNEGKPVYDYYAKIFYFDKNNQNSNITPESIIRVYNSSIKNDGDYGHRIAVYLIRAMDQDNISVYYQTPIQELVGQGILDVGKAVSGPGALNARRLEKENISSKYLTNGQKTVMYDIDTQGYDSCWDNDIKEIRSGKIAENNTEEDLRERYNYYNLNWISNDKANKWTKALTKAYVDEFNNRVDESGLEGLHVGLIKSGGGILKLNGNNTYQGPTVVTDGAISINGSVAGDAYSEDNGVIMGKGKINGTLYNNNIAIADDGGVGNLAIGALESKGQLISSINNGESSKFIVDGKANIDGSTLVVAGLLPGESCTVLKADSIEGELANSQEKAPETSAFLKEYAKIENNEVKYVYDLSPNFAGVTAKQTKTFDAIKRMYFKLMSEYEPEPENASGRGSYRAATTPQQMAQILTFINLPAAQAGPALNAVTLNVAAQSMTLVQRNSMTSDILSSHFGDRFAKERKAEALLPLRLASHPGARLHGDLLLLSNDDNNSGVSNTLSLNKVSSSSVTTPTCQRQATSPQGEALGQPATATSDDLERGAWFKFVYNKGEMRDGARYHGRNGIIGYDLKLTDTKSLGLFFGHGNNTIDGFDDAWAKNKIEENKFGFYTSRKNDKASSYLYLDYGKVDNELRRNLTNLGLSTNVKYKGNLFEIGGEYKLTPKNQKNKTWKVYPYVNLQFSRYKQDGYHENGGGIYNQVVQSETNNYAAGQLGLEFYFSNEKENYVLRLAGKRAFSGEDPKPTFSFEGDMANKYELDNDQDKNHLLVSFKGERKISANTLLSADFSMQRGSHDRDMKAYLSFWKKF